MRTVRLGFPQETLLAAGERTQEDMTARDKLRQGKSPGKGPKDPWSQSGLG